MNKLRSSLLTVCFAVVGFAFVPLARSSEKTGPGGWKPLFNGTNLDGLYVQLRGQEKNADPNHLVQVDGGALHFYAGAETGSSQPFGYVATDQEYANYDLRLEFKWGEKKFAPRAKSRRDSGLLYHVVGADKVWPISVEYQIQENDVGDIYTISTRLTSPVDPQTTNIITKVSTNRTSGVVRTNRSAQPVFQMEARGGVPFVQGQVGPSLRVIRSPQNEQAGWNTCEIIVRGNSAIHILNGETNNGCADIQQFVGGEWVPLRKGKIALQLEGAEILYRNIQIREIAGN